MLLLLPEVGYFVSGPSNKATYFQLLMPSNYPFGLTVEVKQCLISDL